MAEPPQVAPALSSRRRLEWTETAPQHRARGPVGTPFPIRLIAPFAAATRALSARAARTAIPRRSRAVVDARQIHLPEPPAGAAKVGYSPAPLFWSPPGGLAQAANSTWVRSIVDVLNNALSGKLNATLDATLTANAASTTLTDARISAYSFLHFMPLTANAAAELAGGTLYVTSQKSGSCTVAHANNGQADREFRVLIIA